MLQQKWELEIAVVKLILHTVFWRPVGTHKTADQFFMEKSLCADTYDNK